MTDLSSRRWVNPYIPKLLERPDAILHETRDGFPEEGIAVLNEKIEQFSRLRLELGSGSGMHLLSLASEAPDVLHIGFELRFKRAFRTVEKGEREGLSNLHVVRGDARKVEALIPKGAVEEIYIHFPDPWGKKKWRENRLVTEEYLRTLKDLLQEGGRLSFRTDHREYFTLVSDLIERDPAFKTTLFTENLGSSELDQEAFRSEFELLFRSQNKPIYWILARREGERRISANSS